MRFVDGCGFIVFLYLLQAVTAYLEQPPPVNIRPDNDKPLPKRKWESGGFIVNGGPPVISKRSVGHRGGKVSDFTTRVRLNPDLEEKYREEGRPIHGGEIGKGGFGGIGPISKRSVRETARRSRSVGRSGRKVSDVTTRVRLNPDLEEKYREEGRPIHGGEIGHGGFGGIGPISKRSVLETRQGSRVRGSRSGKGSFGSGGPIVVSKRSLK